MALGFVGVVPLIANSSWVFQDYFGLTPFQYGLCFSLIMLGGSVGAYTEQPRRRARRHRRSSSASVPLRWPPGVSAALVLTLAGAGIPGILVPGVLYMFGVGFTFANALARTMSRFPHAMGAASAVFGVNQFLVGGLVAAALELVVRAVAVAARRDDGGRGPRLRCPMVVLAAPASRLESQRAAWTRRFP